MRIVGRLLSRPPACQKDFFDKLVAPHENHAGPFLKNGGVKAPRHKTMEKQKLDPQLTLMDSAQCFHWRKTAHGYAAIVAGKPMFVRAGEVPEDGAYFDWDRDYGAIARRYAQFPALQRWMDALPGLRVLRQPVWEALLSLIHI